MKKQLIFNLVLIAVIFLVFIIAWRVYFNTGQFQETDIRDKVVESKFETDILVENLDTPWAIDFLPSGEMIFTERGGKVNLYDIKNKELREVGEIDVSEVSESGLLGIAVDHDFESNYYIYLYYTYSDGNRISRFELTKNYLINELIILDNIPNARFHDGGRIKFGPDGKLYATTGDATNPSSSQDINSLAGKILRMNRDGSIPEDNPFGNYVYSYGHRNPQGISWNEENILFASEHGPTRNDEINKIERGGDYGWPLECSEQEGINDALPLRCYTEFTLAPSGIAFYQGDLYIAGLRGTQLRRISFDKNYENIISEESLFNELGRMREVVEHDGWLYIATNNRDGRGFPREDDDKIIRVKRIK